MLERFKQSLSYGLLFASVARTFISTPTLSDMGIILGLCSIAGLQFYLEQNKKYSKLETTVEEKLKDMVHTINTQNEVIKKMALEVDGVRNNVSGLKLQQSMKKVI